MERQMSRTTRGWMASLIAASMASVAAATAAAAPTTISLADWASRVWSTAKAGDSRSTFDLLGQLPEGHDLTAVRDLRAALDRRNKHLAIADEARRERLLEAREEFTEKSEADELTEALRSAVEMHSLADEPDEVLRDDEVLAVVRTAEARAHEAEEEGRWLEAQELFYRLNLLYEEEGRFKKDLERTGSRLVMIRLYAPELFHDMRNDLRVREGEEPLPPFNRMGEDWRTKLEGVRREMIIRALAHARRSHVEGADMAEMLEGGLTALTTFASTHDLEATFDGLGNQAKVARFISEIESLIDRVANRRGRADYLDLTRTVRDVLRVNDRTIDVPEEVVVHEFGDGALSRLDEFSAVIWPDELRRFRRTTEGQFTGVGIQINLDDAHRLEVVTPLAGTPAHRAGLLPGDLITAVDGESTMGITLNGAVERITGKAGTTVTLTVEREGAEKPLEFDLVREDIPLYSVKGWRRDGPRETDWDWFIDPERKIGYTWITSFADTTTQEFDAAIREMKKDGLKGLIVDLRYNPGGLLSQAVSLANRFVDQGVIVSQHDADGVVQDRQRARQGLATLEDIPIAVLINGGSASASEIVAGALQDHDRAVLVGERSFGKGSVQNVYDIGRGVAALRLTTQYYRLPSGRLIHRRPGKPDWGIRPDIAVTMTPTQIGDAITLRREADVLPIDEKGRPVLNDEDRADPDRLLEEGVDTQLESALILVQSQALAESFGFAMLESETAGS